MRELKIGETVEFRGMLFQAVASNRYACKGCYFYGDIDSCIISKRKLGPCFGGSRTDKQDVSFVRVK